MASAKSAGRQHSRRDSVEFRVAVERLGLLYDLLPAAGIISFLVDPTYPGAESQARDLQEAAHSLGAAGACPECSHRSRNRLSAAKFELVINLKAARSLGPTIPAGVLAIDDELIEELCRLLRA